MGACSIKVSARGRNIQEAFNNAQEEAQEEYGSDSYNGQINNCQFMKDVTHKVGDFDEDDHLYEWIIGRANKREVYGYCTQDPITNHNKTKSEVKNIPQHGSRKWETRYVGVGHYDDTEYVSAKTQTEAIKKARAHVEKNPGLRLKIKVTKVLTQGEQVCAEIKYKKSSKERLGSYTFVGWAPE